MIIYMALLGPIVLGFIGESLYHSSRSEAARSAKAGFTCMAIASLGINILVASETDDWWWCGGINLLAWTASFALAARAYNRQRGDELMESNR